MSLKVWRVVTTLVVAALLLSMLPTVTYAGGRHARFHHRHFHRFHGGHAHHPGSSVRLWIGLNPFLGSGWAPPPPVVYGAPPVVYGAPPVVVVPGGSVQPQRSGPLEQSTQRHYCREFQRDIIIDGKPERAYGTACLQPDGTWKIVP